MKIVLVERNAKITHKKNETEALVQLLCLRLLYFAKYAEPRTISFTDNTTSALNMCLTIVILPNGE